VKREEEEEEEEIIITTITICRCCVFSKPFLLYSCDFSGLAAHY
jgi:hypothetical protein